MPALILQNKLASPGSEAGQPFALSAEKAVKWLLIFLSAAFLFAMLILPLVLVGVEALSKGWDAYAAALSEPFAMKALALTAEATAIAVVLNTLFGVASAWLLTKFDFRGKAVL